MILFISAIAFFIATITLFSCQKENQIQPEQEVMKNEVSSETNKDLKASSRAPLILASTAQFSACGNYNSCLIGTPGLTKTNGVKITLDALTHSFFNSGGNQLRYRIYSNTFLVLDVYCNQSVVYLANSILANNTNYFLLISSGNVTSPMYQFTTGNEKGKPCPQPPCPMQVNGSILPFWKCGYYTTGMNCVINTAPPYNVRMNGFSLTLTDLTHSCYNPTGLNYKVYKAGTYNPSNPNANLVDNFTTNCKNVRRVGWNYEDNTQYVVIIQNPNGTIKSSPYYFTTGSFRNKPC